MTGKAVSSPPDLAGESLLRRALRRGAFLPSLATGFAFWWILSAAFPVLVPSPGQIWAALVAGVASGQLPVDILYSFARVIAGFLIGWALAVPTGFALGWYPLVRRLIDPWLQFFRMIPPIALIPLVVLFLGVGQEAKVFVIFIATYLVMTITIYQGVGQVDASLVRAARVLGAKDRDLFFTVILPATLPYILTGVRLGIATAWTTLVASELIAASHGLGYLVEQASQYFEMPVVYLGVIIIGAIGFLMDRGALALQHHLTAWQDTGERGAGR